MLKRFYILLTLLLCMAAGFSQDFGLPLSIPSPRHEVRAVWLTTLSGLDWPHTKATTEAEAAQQREELCQTLDRLQAAGINTVFFQTRIRSTVAYPSAIEPWDGAFTGTPGQAPPYDPLRFALDECHKRGMELHAWVVAFPICKTKVEKQLGRRSLPRKHSELCRKCGDQWMMDPGEPGTADYIAAICAEIVQNYDVDGIHLDYIRYPEKSIAWNDRNTYRKYGKGQNINDWRRENVTRVVRRIHVAVKGIRPWVKLSCSPVGKHDDLPRQSSYGWNARGAVSQDAQAWLKEGLMDCLFPMMYFDGKHFYPFAQDWQENAAGRIVAPGLGIYFLHPREKDWELNTITRQLNFCRQLGMGGTAHFRSKFLTDNVKGLYDYVTGNFHRRLALIPPMTWADSIQPDAPKVKAEARGRSLQLAWNPIADETPIKYNIYRLPSDTATLDEARLIARGLTETGYTHTPALSAELYAIYAVTATDAYGNESRLKKGCNIVTTGISQPHTTTLLTLPQEAADAEYLLITEITNRPVCQLVPAKYINIYALDSGTYRLYGVTRKGAIFHIMDFRR